jgi:hypothetical protein
MNPNASLWVSKKRRPGEKQKNKNKLKKDYPQQESNLQLSVIKNSSLTIKL